MIVEFDKSFFKSLTKIDDRQILKRIEQKIIEFENADNLNNLSNIKKLTGYKNYYRLRTGDYRLGFELIDTETIRLIIAAHRKDIFRQFP
jgi:mRNA interferase RelE/StbE